MHCQPPVQLHSGSRTHRPCPSPDVSIVPSWGRTSTRDHRSAGDLYHTHSPDLQIIASNKLHPSAQNIAAARRPDGFFPIFDVCVHQAQLPNILGWTTELQRRRCACLYPHRPRLWKCKIPSTWTSVFEPHHLSFLPSPRRQARPSWHSPSRAPFFLLTWPLVELLEHRVRLAPTLQAYLLLHPARPPRSLIR